jgi:hypothetical protein
VEVDTEEVVAEPLSVRPEAAARLVFPADHQFLEVQVVAARVNSWNRLVLQVAKAATPRQVPYPAALLRREDVEFLQVVVEAAANSLVVATGWMCDQVLGASEQ